MTALIDFIALVLAGDACVTAWFYGSIFEEKKKKITDRGGLIGELFDCPTCLSYHVAWILTLAFWIPSQLLPEPWSYLTRFPLYSLAATDLIHWLQGERPIRTEEEVEDESERS